MYIIVFVELADAFFPQLIAKIPTMVIKIEGGVGKRTVPLLIVEASFSGEVKDWSSKVS